MLKDMNLQGQHIRLRAIEPGDLEFVHRCENNSDLWHLGCTVQPFSKETIATYLDLAQHDIYTAKQLRMMIETHDGRAFGMVDLFDFDPKNRKCGIGILIAEAADRQQGYAKDALQVLCDYSVEFLGLHQLYCHIATNNAASIALFKAAGFKDIGVLKDWVRMGHSFVDAVMMQRIANA